MDFLATDFALLEFFDLENMVLLVGLDFYYETIFHGNLCSIKQ
jgi:hypothetical protein